MDEINTKDIIHSIDLSYTYYHEGEDLGQEALSAVNLSVKRGSFTAIIGQNGSGKSTLAKQFNCLLLPTGGKVYIDQMDSSDEALVWEIRKRCGAIFQNPDNQLVSSVVEDDVAFGPENIGLPREEIKKRIADALAAVGMSEHKHMAPHLLSGGQKQRVAIAGVLAMKPQIIVFDEPTAMLDPNGRKDVLDIIHRLKDDGITVVLITHFMEETVDCDQIYIMDKGQIAMSGKPMEIFSKTDELKSLGLLPPFPTRLAKELNDLGIDVPLDAIRHEDIIESLIGRAR